MNIRQVIIAFLVLASSTRAPLAGRQQAAAPVSIPFELENHLVIVNARVNNSGPLAFIFDTGASAAIVRTETARNLGLSMQGTVNGRGAGAGVQVGSLVKNATWSLIGLERVSQPVAIALPLPALPSSLGRRIDGIIGGDFIGQFVVEVDYESRRIRLHDRKTFVYQGPGAMLPIEFTSNGHPLIRASVTLQNHPPIAGRFLLDLGSSLALALHSPVVAEQHLVGPESTMIRSIGGAGVGGRTTGHLGRVAALQVGSFTIRNPVTLFSEDKAGAFADASTTGNIGAQIAERFRMFLDYAGRRIILEPLSSLAAPFDRAFSGIVLRAEDPDFHTFRVDDVLDASPASEAGLTQGDIVTAIDGRPAETLTLSILNELLQKPDTRELTIRRAGALLTITLTPRRLI
jgi:Aspartyl protease/PDZ domain